MYMNETKVQPSFEQRLTNIEQCLLKGVNVRNLVSHTDNPITVYESLFKFINHKRPYISGSHCVTLVNSAKWLLRCCGTEVKIEDFLHYNHNVISEDVACLEKKSSLLKICEKYFRHYDNNVCSYDSYQKRKILLNSYINYLIEYEYLNKNVFKTLITIERQVRKKAEKLYVSPKKVGIILKYIFNANPLFALLFALVYYTGMRLGEAIALKYSDIQNGFIYIRRTRSLYNTEYTGSDVSYKYVTRLKGRHNGEYRIARVVPALKFYIDEVLKLNYNTEYIFKPTTNYRRLWNRLIIKLGYNKKVFKPNYLRSLYITEISRLLDIPFLSKKVGTSPKMVYEYYLIINECSDDIIIDRINEIFK